MKKTFIALLALCTFIACTKEKTNLHLTGNVKGLTQGTLYIKKIQDSVLVSLDTIKIDGDSNFKADLYVETPELYYLFLDRGVTNSLDNSILFFAEPGKMNIQTELEGFLTKAKITGSENQKLFEEFKKMKSRFNDQNLALVEKGIRASMKNDTATLDSINKEQDKLTIRTYRFTANYALTHGNYEIAPYLALSEIYDMNTKYLDTIQKTMSPKVAASKYGKLLTKFVTDRKKDDNAASKAKEITKP